MMNNFKFEAPSPTSASSDSFDLDSIMSVNRKEVVQSTMAESKRSPNSLDTKTLSRSNAESSGSQESLSKFSSKIKKSNKSFVIPKIKDKSKIQQIVTEASKAQARILRHNTIINDNFVKNYKSHNKFLPVISINCPYKVDMNSTHNIKASFYIGILDNKCIQCGHKNPSRYEFCEFYAGCEHCFAQKKIDYATKYFKEKDDFKHKKNISFGDIRNNMECRMQMIKETVIPSLTLFRQYYKQIFGDTGCALIKDGTDKHVGWIFKENKKLKYSNLRIKNEKINSLYLPLVWQN